MPVPIYIKGRRNRLDRPGRGLSSISKSKKCRDYTVTILEVWPDKNPFRRFGTCVWYFSCNWIWRHLRSLSALRNNLMIFGWVISRNILVPASLTMDFLRCPWSNRSLLCSWLYWKYQKKIGEELSEDFGSIWFLSAGQEKVDTRKEEAKALHALETTVINFVKNHPKIVRPF